MSLHVFGNVVTTFGTAANNRGTTDGNTASLQKLLWQGETHTTVSAESIRFALRRLLAATEDTNRTWNESASPKPRNEWRDDKFSGWSSPDGKVYIDDDLLGFMSAQAAKEEVDEEASTTEGDETSDSPKSVIESDLTSVKAARKSKTKAKGTVNLRRGVLELTRAVSITPWSGDITFNSNSPWSNLGAKDKDNPGIYVTEMHATRYQYGFALTPERLRNPDRTTTAINAIANLGNVAGNQGRFLFDFSPEAILVRVTQDPAPRFLYTLSTKDNGATLDASMLVKRITAKDICVDELWIGVADLDSPMVQNLREAGVKKIFGVKEAIKDACININSLISKAGVSVK